MTEEEIRVIKELDDSQSEWIHHSDYKVRALGMEKSDFLRVCRQLRDMGYARLTILFNDEYQPNGSAYTRTETGDALVLLARGHDD